MPTGMLVSFIYIIALIPLNYIINKLEYTMGTVNFEEVQSLPERYPMTYDQPCQIDCRVASCKFNKGAGKCENVSPAITLNENGKFVCWSKADHPRPI